MIKKTIPKPYKGMYWYRVTLKHGALDGIMDSFIVDWMIHNQNESVATIYPPERFNLGSIQKVNSKPPFMNFYFKGDYESFLEDFQEIIAYTEEPYNQKHIDMWEEDANIIVQDNLLEHAHRFRFTFLCENAYLRRLPADVRYIFDVFESFGLTNRGNGYVLRSVDWNKLNVIFSHTGIASYIKLLSPPSLLGYERVITPNDLEQRNEQ